MSGEIDGHCPTLHHPLIVNLSVFMTLFVLHLHFASLDVAISRLPMMAISCTLMHFIWSAKPPQLTSCHSGVSYDITPLAPDMPPPRPRPLPSHPSAAFSNFNVQLSPNAALLYFIGCYLPQLFYQSFTSQYFFLKSGSFFKFYFSQRLEPRPIGEQ